MRLTIFLAWLFLGAAGLWQAAAAQDVRNTRAEIIRLLGQLPDVTPIRGQLVAQGFQGEKLALAEDHSRRILNDPVIAGYIADRVIALSDGSLSSASAARGLVGPLYDSGITRLPLKEMLYYHKVNRVMMEAMAPRDCGMMVRNALSPPQMDDVLGRAEARLSAASLRSYYRIQRKALRIGVTQGARRLSPTQAARTEALIFEAMKARLAQAGDDGALSRAFADVDRASNARACQLGKLYIDVVLGLKGRDLLPALLYLSTP